MMTIEDGLDELEDKNPEKKENNEAEHTEKPACTGITKIMRSYVDSLVKYINGTVPFEIDLVKQYAEHFRINQKSEAIIPPIPRAKAIDRIRPEHKELQELLRSSDIIELLPDPFDVADKGSYAKFPGWLNLKDAMGAESLNKFNNTGIFIIPNLEYLSFFVEEGELLRKYAQLCPHEDDDPLFGCRDKRITFTQKSPFETAKMLEFCKQGNKNVMKMVSEVQGFYSVLHRFWNDDAVDSAQQELFERLKKHNPQLIYNGGK